MPVMPKSWKQPDSGIYYHRIEAPKDIRDKISTRWIKKSLRTNNFSEAKQFFLARFDRLERILD